LFKFCRKESLNRYTLIETFVTPFDVMKIQDACIPCLMKRILFEIRQSSLDDTVKTKALRSAASCLSKTYDPNGCSAVIATKIHKAVYTALDDQDPYRVLKKRSNEIATTLLPTVEKMVKDSKDPLYTSMLCAIIGNMLDFGIEGASSQPEMLLDVFEDAIQQGIGYDDYPKIRKLLETSHHLLFFTDNCGEIAFDKILIRELRYEFPRLKVSLIVKGEPVLSDATMKDAMEFGFETVVDEILTTGCFAVGVDFNHLPALVKNRLAEADIIVCKGMANYESFSETSYRPILYLLRSKCQPIADSMNVPVNSNIIKLYN